jgi:undecaprenyl-diphosphatase
LPPGEHLNVRRSSVLPGLLAVAAGVLIFVTIAINVKEGATQAFDRRLLLAMRQPGDLSPIGSRSVQEAARDFTSLGGAAVLALVTLATAGFLALDGKKHMALFTCASVAGGVVMSSLLKDVFQRPRPEIVPHIVYASNTSFPSGHSMLSAVTYLTIGALLARSHERRALKAYFLVIAALLSIMVGVTRVYLGVHWPTDVLAGWTAGAVWALLCWLVAGWLQSRKALEPEEKHTSG